MKIAMEDLKFITSFLIEIIQNFIIKLIMVSPYAMHITLG